ncbi:unnamed protein product [Phytomonas sp. EM1]|nr:unnamed protein product [Phytomonas sp. EM1]|eukprot:CCW60722.1 unnamed protein product [Phytomonas sp. isolate EM1]
MIRMHEVIIECFTRENSIASIALKRLGSGASSNSKNKKSFHFVVQVELLKAFLLRMLPQQVMVMLVAMVYRLFRDIPRKIYVALRWDMVTIAFVHSIGNVISILFLHSKPTLSTWAIIGWPVILLGTINYLYGSSKRAGMVVTISSSYTLTKTIRGLIMCVALRYIISLLALSLLVSVHVVELITIWFMLILIILWIPAIIDSCSLEGIIFVTSSSSIMLYFMDQLSIPAALRLGLMVMLWWLNVSLLYNLAVNIFHTRYAGISVVLCLFLWTILPPKQKKEPWGWAVRQGLTAGKVMLTSQSGNGTIIDASTPMIDTVLQQKIKWMCDVVELRAPFECKTIWLSQFVRSNEGCGTYHYVIFVNLGLNIILVTLLTFLSAFQSPEVRLRLEQNNLVLVTAGILIRKFARAIVITFCVVSFLASWWAFHQCILPYFTPILPSLVSHVVSGVFACITLGALMDMKDTMYEGILQVLGLMDPEEYNQESSS